MTESRTVMSVLVRHGFSAASEGAIAGHLEALLTDHAEHARIDLSSADAEYLARHSGVAAASDADLADLDARSVSRVGGEAALSLDRRAVAAGLGVDPSRVSHRTAAGEIFSYRDLAGRPIYPDWQFLRRQTPSGRSSDQLTLLPGLRQVLAALPPGSHPVSVRAFMTAPNDDLVLRGESVSPRTWLSGGGDPGAVVEQASTLGEQV